MSNKKKAIKSGGAAKIVAFGSKTKNKPSKTPTAKQLAKQKRKKRLKTINMFVSNLMAGSTKGYSNVKINRLAKELRNVVVRMPQSFLDKYTKTQNALIDSKVPLIIVNGRSPLDNAAKKSI